MYEFIQHLHSGWAYIALLFAFLMLITAIYHRMTQKPTNKAVKKIFFLGVLSFHLQFVIGLLLYIFSPIVKAAWNTPNVMKVSELRLIILEHPLMMFTAVILITIANAKLKRTNKVNNGILLFVVLAALCLVRIPWSAWMAS